MVPVILTVRQQKTSMPYFFIIPGYLGLLFLATMTYLYLSEFDRLCLKAQIPLVRYGDDFVAVFQSYLQANRSLRIQR